MLDSGSIDGSAFDLRDLFGHGCYRIEYYQREYAWSAEDVRTLLTDLFGTFDERMREGRIHQPDAPVFFLGPFVYVQEERQIRFLVDGQQRFTTLHLLFLHLHRTADRLGQRDTLRKLDRVITDFGRGGRLQFRLDIDERRDALEALYRDHPYEVPFDASLSVRNLYERSGQIAELLDGRLEAEHWPVFVDWLLSKVVLVGIRAPNRNSGFRIFESMNDRGARLTPVDLVKSFLLSSARRDEEKLNEQWRRMLAKLTSVRGDTDAPRGFLKSALLACYADLSPDSGDAEEIDAALNVWLRRNAEHIGLHQPDDFFRFIEDLLRLAGHHRTFLEAGKRPYPENGLNAVYYNEANGLTDQMALLLAAVHPLDTGTSANQKAALIANYLDRIYVERFLNDEPAQAKDLRSDIHSLIPALRNCTTVQDVADLLSAGLPTGSFEQIALFGMRGNNRAQVRYLLARLTAYVESGLGNDDPSGKYLSTQRQWQIEHLYANHPERHVPHDAPDEATFRAWRSRLGVLVLLRQDDNASYNDAPLDEKRRQYARQNALAAILAPGYRRNHPALKKFIAANRIESHFRELGNATMKEAVELRGELYRRLCERIWDPVSLGFRPIMAQPPAPANQSPSAPQQPRRRPLRTYLASLMREGVLPAGTTIEADHKGRHFTATVDSDGVITLPSGDRFNTADEAGKTVCGTRSCVGMAFWHVTTDDGRRLSLREVRDQYRRTELLGTNPRG
ncbi:DUF262 domain-containing protein [Streptomyces sp. NPDC017991]|uniref:GmrSD restriction endonuclease domain-containing protein n=1 Tax=Streptomyces sp. NPDC017991 TaxID=3365026 RepID=UPI0037BD73BA